MSDQQDEHIEHATPTCPQCGGERTRPLDDDVAVCFGCDNSWYHDLPEEKTP